MHSMVSEAIYCLKPRTLPHDPVHARPHAPPPAVCTLPYNMQPAQMQENERVVVQGKGGGVFVLREWQDPGNKGKGAVGLHAPRAALHVELGQEV